MNNLQKLGKMASLIAIASAVVALSACAHQDLKAPCSLDRGWSFGSALADDCGLFRPVNKGKDHG